MKMLILRCGRHFDQLRACVPIVRTKTRKYGQVLDEHWLPTKRDWMFLGANAAGKTRWLQRLHSHAPNIWRDKPSLLLIPINLRMTLLQRDPVIEALKSDAAYDATAVFLWLLIQASMGAGAWQLAAILGGMKFLGRGSRAARQT